MTAIAPRCSCTREAGDSRCDAHPSCSECGEPTARNVDDCADHCPLCASVRRGDVIADAAGACASCMDRLSAANRPDPIVLDTRPHDEIVVDAIAREPMPLRRIVEATGLHQDDVRRALARLKYAGRAVCGRRDGVPTTYWSVKS